MTASVAPSAAPPHAVKVWADHMNIYAEIPSLHQPCVLAFPLSSGGLSKVLSILGAKHQEDTAGVPYLRSAVIAKALIKDGITQNELSAAREVLLTLGMIK